MPRCPKCQKVIEHVEEIRIHRKISKVFPDRVDMVSYTEECFYKCPLCKSIIFKDLKECMRFLKRKR